MDKLASTGQSVAMIRSMKEAHREAERMRDVTLLLQHLNEREETTIKMILDCLYDVGSVNLINQKFQNRQINRFLKAIAWLPKPAFRLFAMRWFKKNCPRLITNWLHRKVSFPPSAPPPSPAVPEIAAVQSGSLAIAGEAVSEVVVADLAEVTNAVADRDRQIQQLRSQVRVLTGLLIGMVLLFGGALALPNRSSGTGGIGHQEPFSSQP
ncbi:MAG: hypothetical protein WCA35_30035 [Kovacikia sp.]